MLNQLQNVNQNWNGNSATVDNWLKARQTLMVNFCELAGIAVEGPSAMKTMNGTVQRPSNALPDADQIERFCEDLMDYLSAGHFEIYDILSAQYENGQELKQQLAPKIAVTTDIALRFNDSYTEMLRPEQATSFDADLAQLGEALAERFELEDQLFNAVHQATTE
ncbi:sigma D regulator [Alteromonas halophila]|uniref:Sigma D regulator n=1 Tax=Alteromonas halophila TaxID=516698 RepID=A0A918JJN3_9ALTE|nr:sigma D regulator [Alteromonas halophila]GGW83592.1 sigma D regulator [Alteromonas halophila]